MKYMFILVGILVFNACSIKPEPILYGKDACHTCKMTLVDTKYGAEVVTTKGKMYKFDDTNCLISFLNAGTVPAEEIAHTLIIDFSSPEKLIPAASAFFLASDQFKSPMASNVAAFGSESKQEEYKSNMQGEALTWDEVKLKFGRQHH